MTQNKDIEYSNRFWSRNQLSGIRESMIEIIAVADKRGLFTLFVSPFRYNRKR